MTARSVYYTMQVYSTALSCIGTRLETVVVILVHQQPASSSVAYILFSHHILYNVIVIRLCFDGTTFAK